MLGSYELALFNMTMTMILFQLKTKVIWFIEDYILLIEEETCMGEHDHHLGMSIQKYLSFSLGTMMSFFEHICCLIVLINHIILYIKSKLMFYWILSCLLQVNFQVLPMCIKTLNQFNIESVGAGQRVSL